MFFKNIEICPDLSPSGSAEKYQRVLSNWPDFQILFLFRILVSELTNYNGAVSFYYPVTPADSGAFRGFVLTEDMYEFIKGKLKLKKGQFFPWLEEELKENR